MHHLRKISKKHTFREKFFVSINKLKFKLRNFKEFYITKNKEINIKIFLLNNIIINKFS